MSDYFATKYDSARGEALHQLASDWMMQWDGDIESPVRSWCALDVDTDDVTFPFIQVGQGVRDMLFTYGVQLRSLVGHWLLSDNEQGFCYVEGFDTADERDARVAELEQAYGEWADSDGELL